MEAYKERMLIEWEALDEKLRKLDIFLFSERFNKLDKKRRKLMILQKKYMSKYCKILIERMKLEGIDITHNESN